MTIVVQKFDIDQSIIAARIIEVCTIEDEFFNFRSNFFRSFKVMVWPSFAKHQRSTFSSAVNLMQA